MTSRDRELGLVGEWNMMLDGVIVFDVGDWRENENLDLLPVDGQKMSIGTSGRTSRRRKT
jgi:hypothetical protein